MLDTLLILFIMTRLRKVDALTLTGLAIFGSFVLCGIHWSIIHAPFLTYYNDNVVC